MTAVIKNRRLLISQLSAVLNIPAACLPAKHCHAVILYVLTFVSFEYGLIHILCLEFSQCLEMSLFCVDFESSFIFPVLHQKYLVFVVDGHIVVILDIAFFCSGFLRDFQFVHCFLEFCSFARFCEIMYIKNYHFDSPSRPPVSGDPSS